MTNYQKSLNDRRAYANIKENAIIGLLGGLILLIVGFVGYLDNSGFVEKLFICLMIIGGAFIIGGLVCPSLLYYPKKGFYAFGNIIGKVIFTVLLSVVYIVFILPVGLIMSRKQKDYMLMRWDTSFDMELSSSLSPIQRVASHVSSTGNKGRTRLIFQIYRLFAYMIMRRQFIMIPALVILLVLGLVFFFISSTVIAPFIYTLF